MERIASELNKRIAELSEIVKKKELSLQKQYEIRGAIAELEQILEKVKTHRRDGPIMLLKPEK